MFPVRASGSAVELSTKINHLQRPKSHKDSGNARTISLARSARDAALDSENPMTESTLLSERQGQHQLGRCCGSEAFTQGRHGLLAFRAPATQHIPRVDIMSTCPNNLMADLIRFSMCIYMTI